MRRGRRFVAMLVGGVLLAAGCAGSPSSSSQGPPVQINPGPTSDLHGATLGTALAKPDITLTDTSGKPFNLVKGTAGKLTLLYFGYTHCPDVCPATMADLGLAVKMLTRAQQSAIDVVFVTSDPWRDTPPVLRSWLNSFDPAFIGLTGSYTTIQNAARALGIDLEKPTATTGDYDVTHGAEVLAFAKNAKAKTVYTAGVSAKDYAADLPKLLAGQS
jgi:protein SCO1